MVLVRTDIDYEYDKAIDEGRKIARTNEQILQNEFIEAHVDFICTRAHDKTFWFKNNDGFIINIEIERDENGAIFANRYYYHKGIFSMYRHRIWAMPAYEVGQDYDLPVGDYANVVKVYKVSLAL